ncbi:TPM domain-containing protein [Vitreoscilla massiliensis]|uniref:TPM domain-containing protein n=1 Tax=Vitreoscilla massiliensis TaxID=1689272 RepID=UPI00071D25BA|nr:TPM domain-containing protein [Vitreoscilla massiliensis]
MQRVLQAALMWFTLLTLMLGTAHALDLQAIPKLTQPVMDTAHMLSASEQAQLNQQLEQYAQSKGTQIVVLTVNTTAPEDAFTYGMRVVDRWQLGRAKEDDGVLLLIAKDDRKNQILVGRGLEGVITDVDAYRILSENVRPAFQQGDYAAGITAAVDKLQGLIAGEKLPEPPQHSNDDGGGSWMALLIPLIFLASFLKRIFGGFLGSVIGAVVSAGACLFFGTGLLVALAVAAGVFVFSLILGAGAMVFPGGGGGGHWGGGGGFGGGSYGGGGGGGFSGGGGSFSGGGASGDW